MSLIEAWLLEIMRCPRCSGTLEESVETTSLVCNGCSATYPVIDGIPDMVIDE